MLFSDFFPFDNLTDTLIFVLLSNEAKDVHENTVPLVC